MGPRRLEWLQKERAKSIARHDGKWGGDLQPGDRVRLAKGRRDVRGTVIALTRPDDDLIEVRWDKSPDVARYHSSYLLIKVDQ